MVQSIYQLTTLLYALLNITALYTTANSILSFKQRYTNPFDD